MPTLPNSSLAAATATLSSASATTGSATRSRLIAKAWAYFDSLWEQEWESTSAVPSRGDKADGHPSLAVDPSIFAVMFKGLTASGPSVYHPSILTDPEHWLRPITHLLPHLRTSGFTLLDVMRDPIFMVDLPSYLGKVEREKVLDALASTGEGRSGWEDWRGVVDSVRELVQAEQEGIQKQREAEEAVELDPTMTSVSFKLPPSSSAPS